MGNIEKQLRSIPGRDQERVFTVIEKLLNRDFSGLDWKKLKGYQNIFRIRVGNYRILYYDDGVHLIIKAVRKRNESTYKGF